MKDSKIYIADRHTAVAAFKMTGISLEAEANSEAFKELLHSITHSEKGPVRYGVEILLRSVSSPDSVTGKILEAYISMIQIQSSGYGIHLNRFLRKMDIVEHTLTSSGYEGVWMMKKDIASLHTSILSGGLIGMTSNPTRMVSGNIDNAMNALVRYSEGESEALSIIAYGCNDGVRTNAVVLASSAARISVLAKAFDSRLRCCIRKLRNNIDYLPVRMSCINKKNNSSSDWGRKLPSLLPSSRIESLATMLPAQPMILGKDFIDNPEAIHLGNIPATGRKLTIPVNSAHSCVIVGRPGYGKSYFLGSLVKNLCKMKQHVIVLDLIDSDFRGIAKDINAAVFSQDRGDRSLDLNPFRVKGFSEQETQKLSTDFLLSAISMFAPQDTFLRDTVSAYYSESTNEAKGSISGFIRFFEKTFPKLNNYAGELQSNHIGALKSRLRKLQSCLSDREFCPDMILKNNAIIELEKMDSREDKAISLLFLLNFLIQIKRREAKSGVVTPTFLIVDEAAELLSGGLDKDIDVAGRNLRDMLLKVIRTCRKIGLYLICATQDYHSVADYFQQSHVRILMNNKYLKEMGTEWEPYQLLLPKLKVGQCLIEMSEFSKPLLFQTPEFTFGPKMSDEMVTQYMREKFPEYISGIKPYDVALPVVSYVLSQLSELKGNELEVWKSNFNIREFITKILTTAGKQSILEDVLVEVRKIGCHEWLDLKI